MLRSSPMRNVDSDGRNGPWTSQPKPTPARCRKRWRWSFGSSRRGRGGTWGRSRPPWLDCRDRICSRRVANRGMRGCFMRMPITLQRLGARLRHCAGSFGRRGWTRPNKLTPRNVPGSSVRRSRMRDETAARPTAARPAGAPYDGYLLDLDGTLYRGAEVITAAPAAVARLRSGGDAVRFVTNNAARTAEHVVTRLRRMGFAAVADEVYTSSYAAARMLAERLPAASRVLVLGTS